MAPACPDNEPPARETEGRGSGWEVHARARRAKASIQFCGLIAGILLFACATPSQAQSKHGPQNKSGNEKLRTQPAAPDAGETIHVSSPLVVVPFTAIAPSGDFVYDLSESDVRVFDNGVQQEIRHFGMASQPTAAVIVVQANWKAGPFLKSIHPLGPLFTNLLLGSKGRAAVVTYSDKVALVQTFSGDPARLKKTLQQIRPEGSNALLNDALARAVRMLARQNRAERRVIIVFSDGLNHGSAVRGEQVVRAACDANVQIFGLRFQPGRESFQENMDLLKHVVYPAAPPPGGPASVRGGQPVLDLGPVAILTVKMIRAQLRKNMLAGYSDYTGGSVYTPLKTRHFQAALQQIALDINSEYVLTYVPSTLKPEGFHRIQVRLARSRLKVHTRSGYFYGVPPS